MNNMLKKLNLRIKLNYRTALSALLIVATVIIILNIVITANSIRNEAAIRDREYVEAVAQTTESIAQAEDHGESFESFQNYIRENGQTFSEFVQYGESSNIDYYIEYQGGNSYFVVLKNYTQQEFEELFRSMFRDFGEYDIEYLPRFEF